MPTTGLLDEIGSILGLRGKAGAGTKEAWEASRAELGVVWKEPGALPRQLRALAALAADPDLAPSTHTVTHNHLQLPFQEI